MLFEAFKKGVLMAEPTRNSEAEAIIRDLISEMTDKVLNSFGDGQLGREETKRLISNREAIKKELDSIKMCLVRVIAEAADEPRRCEFGPEY